MGRGLKTAGLERHPQRGKDRAFLSCQPVACCAIQLAVVTIPMDGLCVPRNVQSQCSYRLSFDACTSTHGFTTTAQTVASVSIQYLA